MLTCLWVCGNPFEHCNMIWVNSTIHFSTLMKKIVKCVGISKEESEILLSRRMSLNLSHLYLDTPWRCVNPKTSHCLYTPLRVFHYKPVRNLAPVTDDIITHWQTQTAWVVEKPKTPNCAKAPPSCSLYLSNIPTIQLRKNPYPFPPCARREDAAGRLYPIKR